MLPNLHDVGVTDDLAVSVGKFQLKNEIQLDGNALCNRRLLYLEAA